MQNIGRILGKYLFPIILILIGILLLVVSAGQNMWFKLGGAGILVVGIIGILYIKGIIGKGVQVILTVVVAAGAIIFGYMNYEVIQDRLEYDKRKEKIQQTVIQNLKDIREAQVAYRKENDKYTDSFDSLIDFLKNGKITIIKRLGTLPDTVPTEEQAMEMGLISAMPEGMTEEEVLEQGLIVRDTIRVDVFGYVYDEDYMEGREAELNVDSLAYVPYGDGAKFDMEADFIDVGGVRTPVFQVVDPKPFDPQDQFMVGSLTKASTSGNWTE